MKYPISLSLNNYKQFFSPKAYDDESDRLKHLLFTLLAGFALTVILFIVADVLNRIFDNDHVVYALPSLCIAALALCVCWFIARVWGARIASVFLLLLITCLAVHFTMLWGFNLALSELLFVMVIVMSGMLLPRHNTLAVSAIISVILLFLAILQTTGRIHPNTNWAHGQLLTSDALGALAVFWTIGLASWLANKEVNLSFRRALQSEAALKHERDMLEVKIKERTDQLEKAQLAHRLQLERLASLGTMSAYLVHEIANPLTAASMSLALLHAPAEPEILSQARKNLSYLERYLLATRHQLQGKSTLTTFSVKTEIEQVFDYLRPLAKSRRVTLQLKSSPEPRLFGDPVKFDQLLASLVSNAIDAYATRPAASKKIVVVTVRGQNHWLVLDVQDFGGGISKRDQTALFEPFYSTKSQLGKGIGLGLSMVRNYVETDFAGKITVDSSKSKGTTFTVYLQDSPANKSVTKRTKTGSLKTESRPV